MKANNIEMVETAKVVLVIFITLLLSGCTNNRLESKLQDQEAESFAYKTCIQLASDEYDNQMVFIQESYNECVSKGICKTVDPRMLEAAEEGRAKALATLENARIACDLKYKY